ncbi:MAG: inorganic phosphate transporter [Chthoniobacter sp.]|uniref:inorganic phosphate transporter n=1 Tax=Chthoniobacter sp. TaxID=2510640 RepID=UPI0032A22DAC
MSFFHGSNDGQKGMGLIVLILVGILPGPNALNMAHSPERIHAIVAEAQAARGIFEKQAGDAKIEEAKTTEELSAYLKASGKLRPETYAALVTKSQAIETRLGAIKTFTDLPEGDRRGVRTDMYLVGTTIGKMEKVRDYADSAEGKITVPFRKDLETVTKYIPDWVKVAVAIALGLGITVGWKRIVVTVGEKIGKSHLTYAQGACAEVVAMITIALADTKGWPVSTTHVLSSGIAGTMAANKSGLQAQTLRNILLAWVLTLPVCIFLGSLLFAFGNYVALNVLGVK